MATGEPRGWYDVSPISAEQLVRDVEIANLKAEVTRLQDRVPDHVAASARVIGLHLDEFCDKDTEGTYYDMIAEAARRSRTEIERLRRMLAFAWSMRRSPDCDCEHCEEVRAVLGVRE